MNLLKNKLEQYEDAVYEINRLTRGLEILEFTAERKKDYKLGGNVTFYDHTGSRKEAVSIESILTAHQLVDLIQARIGSLSEYIEKTKPVLEMAEMAFKGMEK